MSVSESQTGHVQTDVISQSYGSCKQIRILTLTLPDLLQQKIAIKHLESGIDCWELRGDLLKPKAANESKIPSSAFVEQQIRYLRSHSALPILFTLRTKSEGGEFPDTEVDAVFSLLSLAIDLGCEHVECSHRWPIDKIKSLASKASGTKIVGSYHSLSTDLSWSSSEIESLYTDIDQYADIVSISLPAKSIDDNYDLAQFLHKHRTKSQKPILALATGKDGRLSRFTAPITQVTHPDLPSAASPDLPTVAEVNQALHLLGQLPSKKFYIFGHNISHSLSPTLHNTGFKELGLPHHYSIHESESVDASVEALISQEGFGGASVTFPHKLQVGRLLDSLSPVAAKVGAVNTVVVRTGQDGKRVLLGDNTDWLGIKRCIDSANPEDIASSAALVLGAGGAARAACYAVQDLGISDLLIVNRTRPKAEDMASLFLETKTHIFGTLEEASQKSPKKIRVIVACVPADDLHEDKIPTGLFGADDGVLVEMAYRPQVTGMMKVAGRKTSWSVFRGIDVLEEQAYAQFELWAETAAPTRVMGAAMRAKASEKL